MRMTWCDLLFAHWPVDAAALAALIPSGLTVDVCAGRAWLGVVPFTMRDTAPRWAPCGLAFEELNVRTYVTAGGKPGVWFFSLDARSRLAVEAARHLFYLPYFKARMGSARIGDQIAYAATRTDRRGAPAELRIRYRPTGAVFTAAPDSIERFLTARYCLYAADRRGRLWRSEVDHAPWPLQPAEAQIERNEYPRAQGVNLGVDPPLLHFARELAVVAWLPCPV